MKKLMSIGLAMLLPVALVLISCGEKKQETESSSESNLNEVAKSNLSNLEWILGTWKSAGGETVNYEEWAKVGDAEFSGRSFRIKGSDTMITELLTLAATDSGTFYIADVAHNPEPTFFKMSSGNAEMAVFENPMHDFPQTIKYSVLTPDSLLATVEGDRDGKMAGFEVRYERISK